MRISAVYDFSLKHSLFYPDTMNILGRISHSASNEDIATQYWLESIAVLDYKGHYSPELGENIKLWAHKGDCNSG
jgi:hypothetical protein